MQYLQVLKWWSDTDQPWLRRRGVCTCMLWGLPSSQLLTEVVDSKNENRPISDCV